MVRIAAELAALWVVAAGAAAPCQSVPSLPTVHAAFAAEPQRQTVAAIAWWCLDFIAQRPEWPRDLDPKGPFSAVLSNGRLGIVRSSIPLPDGVVAVGSCSFGAAEMLWTCASDGIEDWYVPHGFDIPPEWRNLLDVLDADLVDVPRSLDLPVVFAHLAGAAVDGDPRNNLRIGASLCGEVTWVCWNTAAHLRVRGRSAGGLGLPIALALLGRQGAGHPLDDLSLRAFAARDTDRAEAARQLGRATSAESLTALRALLHAEDSVRLAAIDALVRRREADELPRIVAAAGPSMPWASLAASDALRELLPSASPAVRQRTRAAIAASQSTELRRFHAGTIDSGGQQPAPEPWRGRGRTLLMLGVLAIGIYGLWVRERARVRVFRTLHPIGQDLLDKVRRAVGTDGATARQ
ncbi:MAG TPA: HEAT repeat domain-containing protein [Planctomycetota bacterium]